MKNISCVLFLLTAGCGNESALFDRADTGAGFASGEDDTDDENQLDTGESGDEPIWWSLGSALVLEKGVPSVGSELTITPLTEAGEPLCETPDALVVTAVTEEISPYKEILTWWRLTLDAPDTPCGGVALPVGDSLLLGVGEMHPDISAAIESIDDLNDSLPLNGAYASLDEEAVFVFGVAGQERAFAGKGEVAESVPLADGRWRVEPVYWFAY